MTERKILIVTNRVPFPFKDGGNLAMQAMIEGYHREGWQVFLLSMNTSRHFVAHEQLAQIYTNLYAFEWVDVDNTISKFNIIKNFLFSKEPEHVKRFDQPVFREKLQQVCRSFKPDVVQIESVFLTPYLDTVNNNCRAITVLRMHNLEYQIWQTLSKKLSNTFKKLYIDNLSARIKKFERQAWKQYDLVLTITEKDASAVARVDDVKRILVAPFSIDIAKIKPSGNTEKWVGYHIGAMDWIPNNESIRWFLDKAWPLIHNAVPEFEFYFAGRNMPEDFKKLNLPGVHCMDEVPSAEEFIEDKKILIVPIWSGGGIRIKILEAMAAAKVVISTSAGIRGIDVKPHEHYLLVKTPADFARAIKWCLENKDDATKMAMKASGLVKEKYEHSRVIKSVIADLEDLLIIRNR